MEGENLSTSEQNERNKLEALDLADKIYKVVTSPEFVDQVPDPEVRHKVLMNKYPNFSQAYPVVLRYLARNLRYKREAFKQFLEKLEKDPGKGMQGFMERQADYARFLYLEYNKGKHPNMKAANRLWREEYENMSKWHKKLLKEEESARNEFEEEEAENLEKKKKELLDFINLSDEIGDFQDDNFEKLDDFHEDAERMRLGLPLKNPNPTIEDIVRNAAQMNKEELCLFLRELKSQETELFKSMDEKAEIITKLKEALNEQDPVDVLQIDTFDPSTFDETKATKEDLLGLVENVKDNIIQLTEFLAKQKKCIGELGPRYEETQKKLEEAEMASRETKLSKQDKKELNEWLEGTSVTLGKKSKRKKKSKAGRKTREK